MGFARSIALWQVDLRKVIALFFLLTLAGAGYFAYLYSLGMSPLAARVVPGRLGVPVFSHFLYGGTGSDALNKPMFAVYGNNDRIYVSDTNNHRIQVFAQDGTPLFKFGERGTGNGQFLFPYGIAVVEGRVLVGDLHRNDIQIFSLDGEFLGVFAQGSGYINGPAMFYADRSGRIFVPNINLSNVAVFDLETEKLLQVIGIPEDMFSPNAVTVDEQGYIYIVNTGGQQAIVYYPDGLRPAGHFNGSADGHGHSVLLNPRGIGLRGELIYVVSSLTHKVHVFDKEGQADFSFGTQGMGNNEFLLPNGLSMDRYGRMIIADTGNNRIAVYR